MFCYRRVLGLACTALLLVLGLGGCAQPKRGGQSVPSAETVFQPQEVRIYRNSGSPSVTIDGEEQSAKEITAIIEDLLKSNTEKPGFVSLATSEELVGGYKKSGVCVELILEEPYEYPLYGADDSRTVNLKRCLILLDKKWLMYADADESRNGASRVGESSDIANAYMSGPLVLRDVMELSKKIESL